MKIGELADATGTQIETIRYYEREGLLPSPGRSAGNYRVYDDSHALRLSFIRQCRALDMNLNEIRVLLRFKDAPEEDCAEVNALLDEHIAHVGARRRELRALDNELRALRNRCAVARDAGNCGILTELSKAARTSPQRDTSHVGQVHAAPGNAIASRLKRSSRTGTRT